jgi:hypothetical protein
MEASLSAVASAFCTALLIAALLAVYLTGYRRGKRDGYKDGRGEAITDLIRSTDTEAWDKAHYLEVHALQEQKDRALHALEKRIGEAETVKVAKR